MKKDEEEDCLNIQTKKIIKELLNDREISQKKATFIEEYIKSMY